ncbi:MAG: putative DNA binding domain-containing protein [Erysipelotrichaceae bacterium]|nr:putative DNA binding domain-containing protein [Erysipelotrichaceae bacterium]
MRSIPNKESLLIEFKSDRKGGYPDSELVDAVVAMANTEGGELYLGVEDNGDITGLSKKHEDEVGLCSMVMNRIIPSLFVSAEIIEEESFKVMRISIPKSRSIVATSSGKVLRRRLNAKGQPENVPMYPFEHNTRLSDLGLLDFSSQIIYDSSIDDFDIKEIARLRSFIKKSKGDEALLELDDEELEKALQLVKEIDGHLYPTITGLLLLGKENKIKEYIPTSIGIFQVLEGTNIRKNDEYTKPLLEMLELFETFFDAYNPENEIDEGLLRQSVPEFSKRAFREGLVNAFCHRDYTMLGGVRVAIDDEGLTISNPGGFIEGVNVQNLLTVDPQGRNKTLADALKRIGLAEKTGRGIDRIYEGSIIYGRPWPDYSETTSNRVVLFIQRAKPDFAFINMIREEEQRINRSLPINSLLILSCIQLERRLNIQRMIEMTNLPKQRVKVTVEKLIESGLIEGIGQSTNRVYILSRKYYKTSSNELGYVRQTDVDILRYEELVLKLTQSRKDGITRAEVMDLLNISKDQAYRLLKKLIKENKMIKTGNSRNTRYYIKND